MRYFYDNTLLGCAWFSWYDFPVRDSVLLARDVPSMAYQETEQIFTRVYHYDDNKFHDDMKFSVILVFGGYDYIGNKILLCKLKKHLTKGSVMLWAADNKLGTRFFCNDKHLGVEGEYFTLAEWKRIFVETDIKLKKIYYAMPDWHMAHRIYGTDVTEIDKQSLKYVDPQNITDDEADLLDDVIVNGMFTQMVNAFIFECRCDNIIENIAEIKLSPTKGNKCSSAIQIFQDKVVKKPLYSSGNVKTIYDNNERLGTRGIKIVPQQYIDDKIVMPYIKSPLVSKVMVEAAVQSPEKFHDMLNKFWQCILLSSDRSNANNFPVKDIQMKFFLKSAYVDMVPTNAFYIKEEYVFFDQEYVYENYPAEFIMFRALMILYRAEETLEKKVPLNEAKRWFGLEKLWEVFEEVEEKYIQSKLLRKDIYGKYYDNSNVDRWIINKNHNSRTNINNLHEANLFYNIEGKKVVLFGAGEYCHRYLTKYGGKFPPAYIIDNDEKKWHMYKQGVEILPPQQLNQENIDELHVIICSRYIDSMKKDLQRMGIFDYRVF